MQKMTLNVDERTKNTKREVGRLRKSGKIPAIVYGQNQTISIAVDAYEFNTKFKVISENVIITLKIGKSDVDVLVKDYQENLLKNSIEHLDFYAIDPNKILRTHVPIHLSGSAIGQREGGILEHLLHEVEVECLPQNLPENIVLDVSALAIHDSIHVRELPALEGVKFINSPDHVVCHVVTKAVEVEEKPAEEVAATPEEGAAPAEEGAPAKTEE